MAEDTYPYPEDEFDELGKHRTPQGVHRAPRPWWRVWGPLIAVVILAPLLAYGLVRLAAGGSNDADPAPTPTVTASAEQTPGEGEGTGEPAPEETEGQTEEPTEPAPEETTPEEVPVDRAVPVSVLNGAAVQGLAGRTQEVLQGLGWTNVTAGNYTSADPSVSTVYYRDASLLPAAQAVAEELGIGPVTELSSIESISVVLRSDFSE